ncbi:hypothetical protein IF2G_09340 [Cordyceps javanica]|nr:hypothetical protein IF2G_09340 [Cordyceps javanica]
MYTSDAVVRAQVAAPTCESTFVLDVAAYDAGLAGARITAVRRCRHPSAAGTLSTWNHYVTECKQLFIWGGNTRKCPARLVKEGKPVPALLNHGNHRCMLDALCFAWFDPT